MCASFIRAPELSMWWETARTGFNAKFVHTLETTESASVHDVVPWLRWEEGESLREGR